MVHCGSARNRNKIIKTVVISPTISVQFRNVYLHLFEILISAVFLTYLIIITSSRGILTILHSFINPRNAII